MIKVMQFLMLQAVFTFNVENNYKDKMQQEMFIQCFLNVTEDLSNLSLQ